MTTPTITQALTEAAELRALVKVGLIDRKQADKRFHKKHGVVLYKPKETRMANANTKRRHRATARELSAKKVAARAAAKRRAEEQRKQAEEAKS